ncbi:MAG TPA: winged helix-turn-helix transcriptional regulator, partial [Bacteroidales bacterium]|nr:winged helix-turn-helix transcriptional regulator [Bacteroidales bacterium]
AGNLCRELPKIDTFIETSIAQKRPVPVIVLREETFSKYPYWATRELLMNALMHRDYETNAPVQFYEYDDRIEVQNPGGLYGKGFWNRNHPKKHPRKAKETDGTTQETTQETDNTTQETTQEIILRIMEEKPEVTQRELAQITGITINGIKYHIKKMTNASIIKHEGPTKSGKWVIKRV